MANNQETITLSIPASEIADIETFESLRAQAYKGHDTSTLTALAESTSLKDGENLFDQFSSILDEDDPSVKARQAAEARADTIAKAVERTVFMTWFWVLMLKSVIFFGMLHCQKIQKELKVNAEWLTEYLMVLK